MSWTFEKVAGPFGFTEGPAWDGECLLFTDIPNNRIMRYDPETGNCTEYRTGTNEGNGPHVRSARSPVLLRRWRPPGLSLRSER